jgi:ABC-2 type transport system permease protein
LSRAFAILRREFRASFEPIAYVTTALFVLLLDGTFFFSAFPSDRFRCRACGKAGRRRCSASSPGCAAPRVLPCPPSPWAHGRTSVEWTEELLLTHPVRSSEIVLGKFLAAWILVGLFISCAVLPVAITVGQLGDLDWSTVFVGLGGALALAAAYVALSLCVSATTREPLVAFLLGAILLLLLWAARW